MAYPRANSCETQIANGTTVTTTNSDDGTPTAGDAWEYASTPEGGSSMVYDDTQAASGTQSYKFVETASPGSILRVGWEDSATTTCYGRVYLYRTALPGSGGHWFIQPQSPGVAVNANIWINPSGFIICEDSVGSSTAGAVPITLNAWVRIEFKLISGDGTSGTVEAKMFAHHSTTVLETITKSGGDTNASNTAVMFGNVNTTEGGVTWWMDNFEFNDSGYPGPAVAAAETQTFLTSRRRSSSRSGSR